jgi:hypothetical protein
MCYICPFGDQSLYRRIFWQEGVLENVIDLSGVYAEMENVEEHDQAC